MCESAVPRILIVVTIWLMLLTLSLFSLYNLFVWWTSLFLSGESNPSKCDPEVQPYFQLVSFYVYQETSMPVYPFSVSRSLLSIWFDYSSINGPLCSYPFNLSRWPYSTCTKVPQVVFTRHTLWGQTDGEPTFTWFFDFKTEHKQPRREDRCNVGYTETNSVTGINRGK